MRKKTKKAIAEAKTEFVVSGKWQKATEYLQSAEVTRILETHQQDNLLRYA